MSTKEDFHIELEFKYCEDCEKVHYRALVRDSENKIVGTSVDWFNTKQQASDDGQRIIQSRLKHQRRSEKGVDFTEKIFSDPMGQRMFLQDFIIVLAVILGVSAVGSLFFALGQGEKHYIFVLIEICLLLLAGYTAYLLTHFDRLFCNCFVYVATNGKIYRLQKYKETSTADEIVHNTRNYRVEQVLFICKKKDRYKIRCLVSPMGGGKAKEKTFWLRPGFNDYNLLTSCFKYLLENTEEA